MMMMERGVKVDHTTSYRWVQAYSPDLDKRCRPYLNSHQRLVAGGRNLCDSQRHVEHLYRAVDSAGNTLDFMLSTKRDAKAVKCFLK